jgi:hypothetical protein
MNRVFEIHLINESSVDFPMPSLDLSVWDEEQDGYHLRDDVREKILRVLDAYEPIDLLDMAREIRIVGSIGTNLYTEDADIDVHIVPEDFSVWDDVKIKTLRKWFRDRGEQLDAFIGKHPIEISIQLNPTQDLLSDGAYDFLGDNWLVGPKIVSRDYDPYEDFAHVADDVRRSVQDADLLMGELKRDVIDHDVIKKAMTILPADVRQRLHLKLQNKLAEIEADIQTLYSKRKEWTDARRDASRPETPEQALQDVELAKNWQDINAVFKFIDRYQYMQVIKDLEELISDDNKVSAEDVDVIRNIVGA